MKEAVPALFLNDKSAMPMQAFEVAKEEAAGMEVQTMLDMEKITLSSIKPTPQMPVKTPPMTREASAEEAEEDTDIAGEVVYAEEVKKEAVPPLVHSDTEETKENVADIAGDAEAEASEDLKEAVPPLVHNDKSAMLIQAFEVAKEETAGMEAQTMLGDMEITLNSIKPTPMPPMPPMDASAEKNASAEKTELELSNRSPTSQFEFDVMHATHKSHSFALMDLEEKSISSEESLSLTNSEVDSFFSAADSTLFGDGDAFVEEVLSPVAPLADYFFCRMESRLPDKVCYWKEAHDELSVVKGDIDAEDDTKNE